MSGYITNAACRGNRPSQFAYYTGYQRQGLVARLLKERGVARFVVAPGGYGKTCLAIDYADVVFNWAHVFFLNCQSPCFIRDLDEGTMAAACLHADRDARLVVFDDVPALDPGRAKVFSDVLDDLMAAGCEVLVTCTPVADVLGQLQPDQVRLTAADLLLTDEELDYGRSMSARSQLPAARFSAADRVAALAWKNEGEAEEVFLKRAFQESLPSDFMLAMASMFVLQRGSIDSLSLFGPVDETFVEQMLDSYPHLRFDADTGSFDAPAVSVDSLACAVKARFDDMVERSVFDTRQGLAIAWANALATDGRGGEPAPGRACDVVRLLCPRRWRGDWLGSHAFGLARAGCFLPAMRLAKLLSAKAGEVCLESRRAIAALEAMGAVVVGDDGAALASARRYAFDDYADPGIRVYCQIVVAQRGSDALRKRALACLRKAAEGAGGHLDGDGRAHDAAHEAALLARVWLSSQQGPAQAAEAWVQLQHGPSRPQAVALGASWVFESSMPASLVGAASSFAELGSSMVAVEDYVRSRIERDEDASVDFFDLSAGLAMERAHMRNLAYAAGPLRTSALLALRKAEMMVASQRQLHSNDAAGDVGQAVPAYAGTAAPSAGQLVVPPSHAQRNVPTLELKLFGCFEASIGGVVLDQKLFNRANVRCLLALLASKQGRELSRDQVAATMWPNADPAMARRNFYAVWSLLKRALSLADGTCPYLVRQQFGCRLEERYVKSDAARLSQICRELLFGTPDLRLWSAMYAELDTDFTNDFMPNEAANALVATVRADYRSRLVEALISATRSAIEVGNPQWGIWFSRMAVDRDFLREDAYLSLMQAQIAADQRTAAMMTFLECQRVLSEELGVDPSEEITALYESLL